MNNEETKLATAIAPLPWWHDPKIVTFLGALFAAVIPATTAVQSWIEKQESIEVSRLTANHQIRMDYVKQALTQNLTEDEQERVYTLLAKFKDDEILGAWAKERLERAQAKKKELVSELGQLGPEAEILRLKVEELGREVISLKALKAPDSQRELTRKQAQLVDAENLLSAKETRQEVVSARVGEPVAATTENWFSVVGSEYQLDDALAKARALNDRSRYSLAVYRAKDNKGQPIYAVTLGGNLTQQEAAARTRYARDADIAADAFTHRSPRWGENLMLRPE